MIFQWPELQQILFSHKQVFFFWCEVRYFDFFFKTLNVIKPATRPDKVQIRVILKPFIKMLHISVQIISDSSGQKRMK